MYDGLYRSLPDDIEIVVHADHPTLNRRVAELLAAGERIDLLSTHAKYAPSQARWLQPLDGLLPQTGLDALASAAVEMCRVDGVLFSAPRNIDVRVLWYRRDLLETAPDSWADVLASDQPFGFPGRESGLFGTFFELVMGAGGQLSDGSGQPVMDSRTAVEAVAILQSLSAMGPAGLPHWHYDEVDAALCSGAVTMAGAWPGAFAEITNSPLRDVLEPALYPRGPHRRVSYSGVHSWAIPTTCGDVSGAVCAIEELLSFEAGRIDAEAGTVCAHVEAFASLTPADDRDRRRLEFTGATIAEAMITYPHHARFPEIEDAGWRALHAVLLGRSTPAEAVRLIQQTATYVTGSTLANGGTNP